MPPAVVGYYLPVRAAKQLQVIITNAALIITWGKYLKVVEECSPLNQTSLCLTTIVTTTL